MKTTCDVCGSVRECRILTLTDKEKETLKNNKDSYAYCEPCWRIVTDREKGARLIQSFAHAVVGKRGNKVYRFLIEKTKAGPIS